jgi:hypothetical protein
MGVAASRTHARPPGACNRAWQSERRHWAQRLEQEQAAAAGEQAALQGAVAEADAAIAMAQARLLGLKSQLLRNDATVAQLLAAVAGAGGPTGAP